jgi:hypothetical protein
LTYQDQELCNPADKRVTMHFSRYVFVGLLVLLPTLSTAQVPPTSPPQPQATGASATPPPPAATPTLSTAQASPSPVQQPPAIGTLESPMPLRPVVTPIAPSRLCSDPENAPGRTLDDLKQIIASCRSVVRNQTGTISEQRKAITLLVVTTTSLTKTTDKALQAMRTRSSQTCKPSNHAGNNNAAPIRQQSKP